MWVTLVAWSLRLYRRPDSGALDVDVGRTEKGVSVESIIESIVLFLL